MLLVPFNSISIYQFSYDMFGTYKLSKVKCIWCSNGVHLGGKGNIIKKRQLMFSRPTHQNLVTKPLTMTLVQT